MPHDSTQGYLKYRGSALVFLLGAIIPLWLWSRDAFLPGLFRGAYNSLTTAAQTAGLLGLSLSSINILLSARYHAVDWLFFGLDRAYRIHRYTGIAAFSLLVIHVASVTLRSAIISAAELLPLWWDFSQPPLVLGRLAFLGFTAVILPTLLVKRLPYETLKKLHQTLGAFLFIGGLHAYLIPSTIAINMPLRFYVLGLAAFGVTSYLIRTILKKWLVPRREYIVEAVRRLTPEVTEVTMQPEAEPPIFIPGQFNFYRFLQPGFPDEDHPFSITAAAGEKKLRLAAKKLGDFTARLPELKSGARALVQGPYGGFTYRRGSRRQVWVAGGIGITPFLSMARTLASSNDAAQFEITLIYSVNQESEAIGLEELNQFHRRLPTFDFHLWITSTQGYLNTAAIKTIAGLAGQDFYLCGPPRLVSALKRQLQAAGVPRRRLKYELFKLL